MRRMLSRLLLGMNKKSFCLQNLKNRAKLIKSYNRMITNPMTSPSIVQVEVTNKCNIRCIMCPLLESKRKKGDMTFGTFKKIVDDASGLCEMLVLTGGEPLLNKHIFEMISYASRSNLSTWLATNATLLDEDRSRQLLSCGLDQLILSFDDAGKETYEATRIGADYERTIHNIQQFLKISDACKHSTFVSVQLISMNETKDAANGFVEKWSGYKVNTFVKPVVNWRANESNWKFRQFLCDKPWFWTAIHYDGTIVPCGHDYNQSYPFGNINSASVKSIWNSSKYVSFRAMLVERMKENNLCRCCEYVSPRPRSSINDIGLLMLDMATISKLLVTFGYKKKGTYTLKT